jgi:hypothetical protein
MTEKNNFITEPANKASMSKRMLLGASIALILIILFLLPVENPKPDWGKFWMIKPLVVVPLAGAFGGLFYHLLTPMRSKGGWKKLLANVFSFIVYIFVLWIGTVLGLNGTLWN